MTRFLKNIILFMALTAVTGCISSPVGGLLVTSTKHHISGDQGAAGNSIGDGRLEKMGSSCVWSSMLISLYIYRPKDTNLAEAMEKAGITKIAVVDRRSFSLFAGLFYRECVDVWGE